LAQDIKTGKKKDFYYEFWVLIFVDLFCDFHISVYYPASFAITWIKIYTEVCCFSSHG